jgi:signal recognition particle receptor subunit beta
MASINYAAREISVKIVYYGPGLSGKTTNLQVIHRKVPQEYRSDMVSLATETDRTLFFDFLPLDLGKIKGFTTKFQLYTVPGQVYYNATRKLVLRGVDGVVFVADSNPEKMQENLESFQNLEENLVEYGYQRENIPIILQYNKRDLPNALPVEELQRMFNKYNLPWSEAVANKGKGVFESLKLIGKIVLDYLNKKYSRHDTAAPAVPAAPAAMPQAAPMRAPAPAPMAPPPGQLHSQPPRPQAQPQPSPFQRPPATPAPRAPQVQRPAAPPVQPPSFGSEPMVQQPPRPQVRQPVGGDPFLAPNPAPRPAQAAPAKPLVRPAAPQSDYANYGMVNLEPMEPQAPAVPSKGFTQQPAENWGGASQSNQDMEIESYRQELLQKQHPAVPASYPAPQSDEEALFEIQAPPSRQQQPPRQQQAQRPVAPQQPFPPAQGFGQQPQFQQQHPAQQPQRPPQQTGYAAPQHPANPPAQPQQPAYQRPTVPQMPAQPIQGSSEQDYNSVYNVAPPASTVQPHAPGYPAQPGMEQPNGTEGSGGQDDALYFTSVDTDRAKKGKKPVNPKTKQSKGLFGKLFHRDNQ